MFEMRLCWDLPSFLYWWWSRVDWWWSRVDWWWSLVDWWRSQVQRWWLWMNLWCWGQMWNILLNVY